MLKKTGEESGIPLYQSIFISYSNFKTSGKPSQMSILTGFEYLGDGSCRAAAMGDGQQQQQPGGHTAGLLAPPALAASTDAISAGFTQQQRGWSHGAALTRQPDHSLQYTPDSRGCSPALPQTGLPTLNENLDKQTICKLVVNSSPSGD